MRSRVAWFPIISVALLSVGLLILGFAGVDRSWLGAGFILAGGAAAVLSLREG